MQWRLVKNHEAFIVQFYFLILLYRQLVISHSGSNIIQKYSQNLVDLMHQLFPNQFNNDVVENQDIQNVKNCNDNQTGNKTQLQ
jgi:hypothetical protein